MAKRNASERAAAAVRDALGRFAPGRPKKQSKAASIVGTGPVVSVESADVSKPVNPAASRPGTVTADRSVTLYNKQLTTPAPRSRQLDPTAIRVAARSFVNRLPDPEGESPSSRERRIDRVAKMWAENDAANGQSIQAALSMPVEQVQAEASRQGKGSPPTPGSAPLLYK